MNFPDLMILNFYLTHCMRCQFFQLLNKLNLVLDDFGFGMTISMPFYLVTGTLKGYDQLLNLVLDEAVEFLRGASLLSPLFSLFCACPHTHTRLQPLHFVILYGKQFLRNSRINSKLILAKHWSYQCLRTRFNFGRQIKPILAQYWSCLSWYCGYGK